MDRIRCHGWRVTHDACKILTRPIAWRARLARNPGGLNLKLANICVISLAEHLQYLCSNKTWCGVRGEDLHIVAKTRIKAPAERRQPSDPFRCEHAFERRLHERAGRLAAQVAVRQTSALNVFVAVPDGRVSVLPRAT